MHISEASDRRRRSILILEDEFFLAEELRRAALDAGLSPLGPFSSLKEGLQAIRLEQPGCAAIDIKLSDGDAYDIVRHLVAGAVPVVFITGHGREAIPAEFRDVPLYIKPCHAKEAIERLVTRMREAPRIASSKLVLSN